MIFRSASPPLSPDRGCPLEVSTIFTFHLKGIHLPVTRTGAPDFELRLVAANAALSKSSIDGRLWAREQIHPTGHQRTLTASGKHLSERQVSDHEADLRNLQSQLRR